MLDCAADGAAQTIPPSPIQYMPHTRRVRVVQTPRRHEYVRCGMSRYYTVVCSDITGWATVVPWREVRARSRLTGGLGWAAMVTNVGVRRRIAPTSRGRPLLP